MIYSKLLIDHYKTDDRLGDSPIGRDAAGNLYLKSDSVAILPSGGRAEITFIHHGTPVCKMDIPYKTGQVINLVGFEIRQRMSKLLES